MISFLCWFGLFLVVSFAVGAMADAQAEIPDVIERRRR